MPKTNPGRPRGPEADVAARVALERARHKMSAVELARRMTKAGCPMNQSAINKIEQGDPPRRISVDELVAFAHVFELELDDLLLPPHAAHSRELVSLLGELQHYQMATTGVAENFHECVKRLQSLTEEMPGTSGITEALAAFDRAYDDVVARLSQCNDLVRQRLREGRGLIASQEPPLDPSHLSFKPRSRRDGLAADAVAGLPPAGSPPPTSSSAATDVNAPKKGRKT